MTTWLGIGAGAAVGVVILLLMLIRRYGKGATDIPTPELATLDWSDAGRDSSLDKVYNHVREDARAAIQWYVKARKPKKYLSRSIRFVALAAVAAAGVIPLVNELITNDVSGIWISIAVALAGAAVAFDKYYDSSTGWIRYITTEQQLRDALEAFELEWEKERAALGGKAPTTDVLNSMLNRARAFASEVNGIVRAETAVWVEQFQSSMKEIETMVEAREEASRNGLVNIVLTNGDQVDGHWFVTDETGKEIKARGKRSAMKLPIGTRILLVRGTLRGQNTECMDQKGVVVQADKITDAEFTLA